LPRTGATWQLIVVRASDTPTYVERGGADLAWPGATCWSSTARRLYQPVDLGIAACRMMVACARASTTKARCGRARA